MSYSTSPVDVLTSVAGTLVAEQMGRGLPPAADVRPLATQFDPDVSDELFSETNSPTVHPMIG